jgi:uncharacterized C2H2 Zn-finger protein
MCATQCTVEQRVGEALTRLSRVGGIFEETKSIRCDKTRVEREMRNP